jgi:MOSC domain-containing protein YiiM
VGEVATIKGRIEAISVSERKGTAKLNVPQAELRIDHGIVGDAHAGSGPRQVSLLAIESIERLREKGLKIAPGDFAENITTEGLAAPSLKVGVKLKVGDEAELEITQLGKVCHGQCAVYDRLGDCIMPKEGVFARVIRGGQIKVGDCVEVSDDQNGYSDHQR